MTGRGGGRASPPRQQKIGGPNGREQASRDSQGREFKGFQKKKIGSGSFDGKKRKEFVRGREFMS